MIVLDGEAYLTIKRQRLYRGADVEALLTPSAAAGEAARRPVPRLSEIALAGSCIRG